MFFLSLAAVITLSMAIDGLQSNFNAHVIRYNLFFNNHVERSKAFDNYQQNDAIIQKHNADDMTTYFLAHNRFSHLSEHEFATLMLSNFGGWSRKLSRTVIPESNKDSVDWSVDNGGIAVSSIADQGSCGSCWAFSTVGAYEGAFAIRYNEAVNFSEQMLVSCDEGDNGCAGGWLPDAFDYVSANSLCYESDFPYVSGNGTAPDCTTTCQVTPALLNSTHHGLYTQSESAMKDAVALTPVTVAVCANYHWQLYHHGIMNHVNSTCHDHGVLVVGYGNDRSGGDYWKIKNSWGEEWGEDGFIRISRNVPDISQEDGPCGMLTFAIYPELV